MEAYHRKHGQGGRERVEVRLRGSPLLNHPMYNRSTAFTREDRKELGLEGLLPDVVSTMEQQARRAYGNIVRKSDPLERYIGLAALQDRNEHLFYRVLTDHLEEFLPIVYTPTVGQACQQYSRIFRRARGLWITPEHRGRMADVLANAPYDDVRLIVVTDNERILGLGDQGAGGMGIPVGKVAIYVAAAGIHPVETLPVSLDVGTDNPALLGDDLYIGYRQPRLRGQVYGLVVDSDLEYRRGLSWPAALAESYGLREGNRDLLAVVGALKPTALLGASGAPGLFTEAVVREMARHVERPLIFPLSNPTSRAEAVPSDLLRWTEGKALVATGSPFGAVEFQGRTVRIGQGNNVFVFPGVGLGALVAEAREITDTMFAAAREALAAEGEEGEIREGAP